MNGYIFGCLIGIGMMLILHVPTFAILGGTVVALIVLFFMSLRY